MRGSTKGKGAGLSRASSGGVPCEKGLLLPATTTTTMTTPGRRKKRQRPYSPGSGDSTKSSWSNHFRSFHHRPLPPPPPRPSPPPLDVREVSAGVSIKRGSVDKRSEVGVTSPGRAEPDVREISAGVSIEGSSVQEGGEVRVMSPGRAEKPGVKEISAGVSIGGGIVEEGDDYDDFVLSGAVEAAAAAGRVRRGTPQASQEGDRRGSPSAPLVDLSELDGDDDDGDEEEMPSARGGSAATRLEEKTEPRRKFCPSQESLGGRGARGGVDVASPASSSRRDKAVDEIGKVGETAGRVREEEEEEAARTLLFLVSANTGRVHVYRQARGGGDADGLDDDSFDEDERRPQHCRWVGVWVRGRCEGL